MSSRNRSQSKKHNQNKSHRPSLRHAGLTGLLNIDITNSSFNKRKSSEVLGAPNKIQKLESMKTSQNFLSPFKRLEETFANFIPSPDIEIINGTPGTSNCLSKTRSFTNRTLLLEIEKNDRDHSTPQNKWITAKEHVKKSATPESQAFQVLAPEIKNMNSFQNSVPTLNTRNESKSQEVLLNNEEISQCSQRFLEDIRSTSFASQSFSSQQVSSEQLLKLLDDLEMKHTIKINPVICSQYVMLDCNKKPEVKSESDQEEDSENLSKSLKKEVDSFFHDAHTSVLGNLNSNIDSFDEGKEEQKIQDTPKNASNTFAEFNSECINNINWDEEFEFESPHTKERSLMKNPILIGATPKIDLSSNTRTEIQKRLFFPISSKKEDEKVVNKQIRPKLSPVSSSSFYEMGPFFSLPKKVQTLIQKHKNISELYDWQSECLNLLAVHQRNNLIYALPTSGGKTLVAEILMMREIICRRKNVLFVLPYVSIVQEKITEMTPFALEMGYLIEEYAAGKGQIPPVLRRMKQSIYISTIEKSLIVFDSLCEVNRQKEIGLIVVDELHMIGDQHRGSSLETLLTKAIHSGAHIQIVGMSATIRNLAELAHFLKADIYTREFRPVELKEYVKTGCDILEFDSRQDDMDDAFKFSRSIGSSYDKKMWARDPDNLMELVQETAPKDAVLIFCPTKANCENVALLLIEMLPGKWKQYKKEEKWNLMMAIKNDGGGSLCKVLTQTLPYGIAYHHSGLTSDERKHLEEGFRLGILCVLCCTSTLAAGVNLPAKRVIIRSPYVGSAFITLSRYKQMCGRAGRAGHSETGESIIICPSKDNLRLKDMLCSSMDETVSGFIQDSTDIQLQVVILNCIGNNIATSFKQLERFIGLTLFAVQATRFKKNCRDMIVGILSQLFKSGAISKVELPNLLSARSQELAEHISLPNSGNSQEINSEVTIRPAEQLEVSKLGKAAVKSGIGLEEAKVMYKHLEIAQKNFVLTDYLHMLYMVTPDSLLESVKPNYKIYHDIFMSLPPELRHTASVIGINEANAVQMITRPNAFKGSKKVVIEKFYITLMLNDLFNIKEVHDVANKFQISRGIVQKLMFTAGGQAACMIRFCENFDEFWAFNDLLQNFSKRLTYCCTTELIPLMELPNVKIGRAKQMFNAGYKSLIDVAKATPDDLVRNVKNVNNRVAKQIVEGAKLILIEKIDTCQEHVYELISATNSKTRR